MNPDKDSKPVGAAEEARIPVDPVEIRLTGHPELIDELQAALMKAGLQGRVLPRMRDTRTLAEIVTLLGTAGAFTALYEIIGRVMNGRERRELAIKRGKLSVSLKGHSLIEEKEVLRQVAPELLRTIPPRK